MFDTHRQCSLCLVVVVVFVVAWYCYLKHIIDHSIAAFRTQRKQHTETDDDMQKQSRRAKQSRSRAQRSRAKQSKARSSRTKKSRAKQSKAEQSKAGQRRAEHSKAEQSKAEHTKAL